MQTVNSSARICSLVFLATSLFFAQAEAFAAPPSWAKGGESRKNKQNKAPVIEGTPSTVAEVEQYYSFQATASDREGDALTFSISNKPTWAAFDTARGLLSGYPAYGDAGSVTNNIVVSVSDGRNTASLAPFSISVAAAPANSPPVIGGTPGSEVIAMETYAFRPSASDADGDPLTFSVANKPFWASFNTGTGQLSGTPAPADLGLYENIRISVTDGTASASLDSFSIAVVDTTNGTATLSWLAPDLNTDGSPLTDLAGYHIYYGNAPGQYDRKLEIADASTLTAFIDNLSQGEWYFAVTALNSKGEESDLSNELQITVQ